MKIKPIYYMITSLYSFLKHLPLHFISFTEEVAVELLPIVNRWDRPSQSSGYK